MFFAFAMFLGFFCCFFFNKVFTVNFSNTVAIVKIVTKILLPPTLFLRKSLKVHFESHSQHRAYKDNDNQCRKKWQAHLQIIEKNKYIDG